jgi:hypothetical protein
MCRDHNGAPTLFIYIFMYNLTFGSSRSLFFPYYTIIIEVRLLRDASGAGHAANPLGQPAPTAPTNPQANPHQTCGSMRVSRSAHVLPRIRPHRVFSTVRISIVVPPLRRGVLVHPVQPRASPALPPTPPSVATPSVSIRPHSSPAPAVPHSSPAPGMTTLSTASLVGRPHWCRHR